MNDDPAAVSAERLRHGFPPVHSAFTRDMTLLGSVAVWNPPDAAGRPIEEVRAIGNLKVPRSDRSAHQLTFAEPQTRGCLAAETCDALAATTS